MSIKLVSFIVFISCQFAASVLAVQFNHQEHLENLDAGEECTICHKQDASQIIPDMGSCQECHEKDFISQVTFSGISTHGPAWSLNHRADAKSNTPACNSCHQQEDCLECHKAGFADEMGELGNNLINVHRSDFHVTHPIAARTDPQLCSSCHENNFCVDCHARFAPQELAIQSHRKGWSLISGGGMAHESFTEDMCQMCHHDSVLPAYEWSLSHSREARKNLATCQSCHPQGDICLKCHSAKTGLGINPHPSDWDDMKGRLKDASSRTCRKCH